MFFGKPGVGKTTLIKQLCEAWNCQYVNGKFGRYQFHDNTFPISLVTDLVVHHMDQQTPMGLEIISVLSEGKDLTDEFVIDMLNDKLSSSDCRQYGYIVDGLPGYTDDDLSIQKQIEFLEQLYPEPYFWVTIDVSVFVFDIVILRNGLFWYTIFLDRAK